MEFRWWNRSEVGADSCCVRTEFAEAFERFPAGHLQDAMRELRT